MHTLHLIMRFHFGSKHFRLLVLLLVGNAAWSCSSSNGQVDQAKALPRDDNAQSQAVDLQPTGYVNDFAGVLQADERQRLEELAAEFRRERRVEVAVVTVTTLGGKPIEEFTLELGRRWGVGHPETRHGILIGLAVKEGQTRIEVSRGLEAVVPAEEWLRIIREGREEFSRTEYGAGLLKILGSLSEVLDKYLRW